MSVREIIDYARAYLDKVRNIDIEPPIEYVKNISKEINEAANSLEFEFNRDKVDWVEIAKNRKHINLLLIHLDDFLHTTGLQESENSYYRKVVNKLEKKTVVLMNELIAVNDISDERVSESLYLFTKTRKLLLELEDAWYTVTSADKQLVAEVEYATRDIK